MKKVALFHIAKNGIFKMNEKVAFYSMLHKPPTINPPAEPASIDDKPIRARTDSTAMKIYVNSVNKYNEFMREQRAEFEIGKRHLANMMGRDFETFTQDDIDESIEYLFPCGLFRKRARPMMKPPEEIFHAKKEAEFDVTGRPFHFLFYSCHPNFYQILHDAVKKLSELENYEDRVLSGDIKDPGPLKIVLDGSRWISIEALEKQLCEKVDSKQYEMLITTLERIAMHPYSRRAEEFVVKYREFLTLVQQPYELQGVQLLEDGRQQIRLKWQSRRDARVHVSVTSPGTGKISIDGKGIEYFKEIQCREQILFPLVLSKMLNKVDIEAEVIQGGIVGIAGAIRLGISRGLASFVDPDTKEKMRLAGLLQRDFRRRERMKPGQAGARKKFKWRKR